MESRPSFSGRFNIEATSSSSTPSTSSPSLFRESSVSRTNSSSSHTKSLFDHNLSSILNNPHSSRSASDATWLGWWSSPTSVILPDFSPITTTATFKPEHDANRSDFKPYLSSISDHFHRFEDIRNHSTQETLDNVDNIAGQGQSLVACLREVPALYFKEDFGFEDGPTFKAACPFSTLSENSELQERLSQYLDVIEIHLVKEISLRSNSFFEAQQLLGDLNVKIVEECTRIRELKEMIRVLDAGIVGSARQIQEFSIMRSNLLVLQQKLRLILYVNQAFSALKLLALIWNDVCCMNETKKYRSGMRTMHYYRIQLSAVMLVSSADCAGALDVADDLQHLLGGDELTGLHCFRHLRDHIAASMDAINSILSAEFMRASLHDAGDLDGVIISKAKERATTTSNERLDDVKLDEEETSNFRDRLLPIIIGLLRIAKLPAVLKMYRDNLTGDMKTAIKTAVADLLPAFVPRSMESGFSTGERTGDVDGGGPSLASRLRSLSSENFVQLLSAIFKIVLAHLVQAAEVKKSTEWIMSNLDGHYAADSVAAAIAYGAAAAESAQDSDSQAVHVVRNALKVPFLQGKANDATSQSNMSKNFRADVLRENTEAVCAACDAAHGRWAKLLGVRALFLPKLRLQEFISIYSITEEFINATEKIGGRLGYSIRGVLHSQAKAFVDYQHESRVTKIKAVLDQETWGQAEIADEFQTIVDLMLDSDQIIKNSEVAQGSEIMYSNGQTTVVDVKEANVDQPLEQSDSNQVSNDATLQENSRHPVEENDVNKTDDVASSSHSRNNNIKECGKGTSQTLMLRGARYHMFNCGLILVKMLSEYIDMNDSLPTLSPEMVHHVVEILKFFNTRTCQLVLGAGAMQVSGLKSITSKHLALASQVVSFIYAVIPDIQRILFTKVPDARKALLQSEIDRVAQDFRVHQDEIHNKLVQIMRERLLVHLRGLPQVVENWDKPDDGDPQPSQFAKALTKEVTYLQRILSQKLHEADVEAIFRQVVIIFHSQISEALSRLELRPPQAKNRLHRDIEHILGCIRSLPTDIAIMNGVPNWGHLDELLDQEFGNEAT